VIHVLYVQYDSGEIKEDRHSKRLYSMLVAIALLQVQYSTPEYEYSIVLVLVQYSSAE
jgi:hypothetical protein